MTPLERLKEDWVKQNGLMDSGAVVVDGNDLKLALAFMDAAQAYATAKTEAQCDDTAEAYGVALKALTKDQS